MTFVETGMRIIDSEKTDFVYARSVLKLYEVNDQYMRLAHLIAELMKGGYYGSLEVKFEAGKITICKKIESIKI